MYMNFEGNMNMEDENLGTEVNAVNKQRKSIFKYLLNIVLFFVTGLAGTEKESLPRDMWQMQ